MMKTLVALATLLTISSAWAEAPSCTFSPGDLPATTLPAGTLHGAQIPINHIVVLMQENRSFDHYFGQLHRQGQRNAEAEPKNARNPNATSTGGAFIKAFHQTRYCETADLDHSWNGTHREFDHGAMDGFTAANVDPTDPTGSRTMGYYTKKDLPFYYKVYRTFAIGDRFFASALTQTFPNRFYLLTGTSFGHIRNDFPLAGGFTQRTIFRALDEAGVNWKIYDAQFPFGALFSYVQMHPENVKTIDQFFSDSQAGTLPQVAFVDPIFVGAKNVENDEHPPANVQVGEEFASRVIKALLASPLWRQSALFLTYDEHGGFYDHVPPPPACVPDDIPPMLQPGDVVAAFDNYGIRVPAVVISPYARKHFVSHKVYDHTSILRFIETRFDLGALTKRDANADPMLDVFNFKKPQFLRPPRLPVAPIFPVQKAQCDASGAPNNDDL